jgi:hypothetical protein
MTNQPDTQVPVTSGPTVERDLQKRLPAQRFPGGLLTRKRSQVQTLSRPPTIGAGQAGFWDPAPWFGRLASGRRAANGQQPTNQPRVEASPSGIGSVVGWEAARGVGAAAFGGCARDGPICRVRMLHRCGRLAVEREVLVTYWWVNQGKIYQAERSAGILWAPQQTAHGRALGHWTAMIHVQSGDIVLHYARGAIRALGRAEAPAFAADRPYGLPEVWDTEVIG